MSFTDLSWAIFQNLLDDKTEKGNVENLNRLQWGKNFKITMTI
jgi:hypothetical protein